MENKPLKIMASVAAVLGAALVATAVYSLSLHSDNVAFAQKAEAQQQQIEKSRLTIAELTKANVELQAGMGQAQARVAGNAEEAAQLRSSVDAFARQAGACESLRQRLAPSGGKS